MSAFSRMADSATPLVGCSPTGLSRKTNSTKVRSTASLEWSPGCVERGWKSNAGSEDRKHTSGGVLVTIDSNVGAVVGVEEGAIDSIPGNEGRIAQA